MKKEDGGCAFPGTAENYILEGEAGMSLRDYFAAHAPIKLIDANESLHQDPGAAKFVKLSNDVFPMTMLVKELARMRGAYADAMIAERQGESV